MSRGFVKEDDQEATPLVTPRAFLPAGVENYVTPNGLEELKKEQADLIAERQALKEQSADEHRVQINYITAKLHLLEERLQSARMIDLSQQTQDEIHFGAKVSLYKIEDQTHCQYQIVGVDEANITLNKISFLSPLAKVLSHKKVGETITLNTPKGSVSMKIEAIHYQ